MVYQLLYQAFMLDTSKSSEDLKQCCDDYNENGNYDKCDFGDQDFLPDVLDVNINDKPAITFTILSFMLIPAVLWGLKNVFVLYRHRSTEGVKAGLFMNGVSTLSLFLVFMYSLNGPMQLFFGSDGYSVKTTLILEPSFIAFIQLSIIHASYQWVKLSMSYKNKWSRKGNAKGITIFFFADGILIIIFFVGTILLAQLVKGVQAFILTSWAIFLLTTVNAVIFSYTCLLIAKYLMEIYKIDTDRRKIMLIKGFAICIGFFSLLRVVCDIANIFAPNWQDTFKVKSYCENTSGWAVFSFFYLGGIDIMPNILFLMMFSPSIKTKVRVRSLNDTTRSRLFGDDDDDDNTEHDLSHHTQSDFTN